MSMSPIHPAPADLANRHVLVMGLGRFGGGVGVSQWLVRQKARVTVTDAASPEDLAESLAALAGLPITFRLGGHNSADFLAADLLVINPAVDRTASPFVQAALARGIPATTELNLFLERCPARTVGVTGSVGKSTTTALIHQALHAALGRPAQNAEGRHEATSAPRVFLGGNIGRSLLMDLPSIHSGDLVILELSSFMLQETPTIRWSPHVAVVTNLFANHLDRHVTLEAYAAAKQNILRFQSVDDYAVLNGDHPEVSRWGSLTRARILAYQIEDAAGRLPPLAIPGAHNLSNAAAVLAVLDALRADGQDLDLPAAHRAIETFTGLPHRLELVHTLELPGEPSGTAARRIRFFNDSKATTPQASLTALRAFAPRSAVLLVGGYDKHVDLSEFVGELARRAAGVVAIGQTGGQIIGMLNGIAEAPRHAYAGTLEAALSMAHQWALGDAGVESIVLSPACASWDQFPNYEKRGELFALIAKSF